MATVSSAYRNVVALRAALINMGRLRQIVAVLTRHGFGALLKRMQLPEALGIRKLVHSGEAQTEALDLPTRLRLVIEELGPTFVKLGQILSTRSDVISDEILRELRKLQSDVPPMPWEDVAKQLEAALQEPVDELFDDFQREALASASIAQVHRARLPDGTEVVVKVQRPDIEGQIASDLNILAFLAARAEQWVPELQLIDPVGIIQEFERAIIKELDFNNERSNIERFGENFRSFKGVKIPQVYSEFCSERVLVMEYLDGVKVTDAPKTYNADPYKYAVRMLRALFKMIFEDGLFHGDLHPGNILVTPDGDLGLIDFGLVGRLMPRQREAILDLVIGVSKEDYELIARVFFELGIKVAGVQYDYLAFEADVVELMDHHVAGKTVAQIDVQAFFSDLVNGAIRHRIKMPPTYTMVFKALMTVEGIGKTLSPELNFVREVRPFIRDMLLQRYSPDRLLREAVETLTRSSRTLRSLGQSAPRLLREIEMGRVAVKVESPRFEELKLELRHTTNRLVRSVVFGASLLAGVLLLHEPGFEVLGMSLFSFAAFFVAALAGVPLIWSLLTRR